MFSSTDICNCPRYQFTCPNWNQSSWTHCGFYFGALCIILCLCHCFFRAAQMAVSLVYLQNNLAEVQEIRSQLMIEPLMVLMRWDLNPSLRFSAHTSSNSLVIWFIICAFLRDFLHSDTIDVSYFAAGIFSHILSDRSQSWHLTTPSRQEMLQELVCSHFYLLYL